MSEAPQWVYFLRPVGEEGPVKIGVSEVPENRLRTYMVWIEKLSEGRIPASSLNPNVGLIEEARGAA